MNKTVLLTAVALISACSKEPEVEAKNASVAEVAEQVAASGSAVKMKAGKWQTTAKVESVDGLSGPAADAMKQAMANAPVQSFEVCMTEADVNKPSGDMFNKSMQNCTYDRFTMGGGKLDAKMTCTMNGQSVVSTLDGTFGAERYTVVSNTEMEQPGVGKITTRTRMESKRIGDCA